MGVAAARANRRIAVWLFLGFLAFYIALTRGHFYLTDEVQVFQQAQSLWERGDLSVAPNINTVRGRGGLYYAQYGIGQSILALPFYLAGKQVHQLLQRHHADSWIKTFEGPVIGDPGKRWGGEVEIFFVNLFCAFVMAALMALFFRFNLCLGASSRWAVAATVILGVTTHVAGFGVEFLQHPAEALLLLLAFYFLFADSSNPHQRYRLAAGVAAGMMIMVRASALVLIPALAAYLLWNAFRRAKSGDIVSRLFHAASASAAFLMPAILAIPATMLVNYAKWSNLSFSGSYTDFNSFNNSWLVSIYGYLFSPGQSIFVFSPILLLAPWYFRWFSRKYLAEAVAILGLTVSYALFYGRSITWHGQWCFGPRYLMALIPLLLLPLASWLGKVRPVAWWAILPLLCAGVFIEILHIAVNVSYVIYRDYYGKLVPNDAYIFVPQISQIVTHWHALLAFDDRVDLWLVNVGRQFGIWRAIEIFYPLLALFLLAIMRINSNLSLIHEPSAAAQLDPDTLPVKAGVESEPAKRPDSEHPARSLR
jgi:hypothetical protein